MKSLKLALCLLLTLAPIADAATVTISGATLSVTDGGGGGLDPWVPTLPQLTVDTTLPTGWDGTADATPANSGALTTALAANQNAGHPWIIQLTAGATYTGPFMMPNKTGPYPIIIRTSGYASLPAVGTRVAPADATNMATLLGPGTSTALWFEWGSHNVRLIGIEITTDYTVRTSQNTALVYCGNDINVGQPDDIADQSSYIHFDRCYIHGTSTGNIRQGIALDCSYGAITDSYFDNIHEVGADSQAIFIYQGAGPYLIHNNHLEAAGENFMAGGTDPAIDDMVPADITFTHNFCTKPLTWKADDPSYAGIAWLVKNVFELKNSKRVLVEGNIFERCWVMGQSGTAILFTVRNQGGLAPQSTVEDVTFRKNIVRNTLSGFNLTNEDNLQTSQNLTRVLIENNLIQLNNIEFGDGMSGNFPFYCNVAGIHPAEYISIEHNSVIGTVLASGVLTFQDSPTYATTLRFKDNLCSHGVYGVYGASSLFGTAAFTAYCMAFEDDHNAFIMDGQSAGGAYHATTLFPADPAACNFTDYDNGDYSITSGSLNNAASDGTDIGADISALNTAISGVEE